MGCRKDGKIKTLKVFYDHQALCMQRFGGISRYYHELIQKLNEKDDIDTEISCLFSQNAYFRGFPGVVTLGPYHWRLVQLVDAINRRISASRIRKGNYEIIHPTYYDPYFLKEKKCRKILTVYDMIQETFPEYYANDGIIEKKKKCIYGADHIIAISENTKKDIIKSYPDINPDKITVVYLGATNLNPTEKREEEKCIFPEHFVLFVGNRFTYKNFNRFFEAMRPIIDSSDIHIVCAGGGGFNNEEKILIKGYQERVHQYPLSDHGLKTAYEKTLCFVFPSLYEGFGLPVLEAYECDCPVVMSNTSSLPEIGGKAADYFDPYDTTSITKAVGLVISDNEGKRSMEASAERKNQRDKFTWEKAALETYDCYKRVIS